MSMRKWLLRFFLLGLLAGPLLAAPEVDLTPVDPAVIAAFRLTESDLSASGLTGVQRFQRGFYRPFVRGLVPDDQRYPYFFDSWERDGDTLVTCEYAVCPTRGVAADAIGGFNSSMSYDWPILDPTPVAADFMQGDPQQGYYLFVVDKVVVRISVSMSLFTPSEGRELGDRLLRTIHQKLTDAGIRPHAPMAITGESVLSSNVNFATGQTFQVRLRVETEADLTPIRPYLHAEPPGPLSVGFGSGLLGEFGNGDITFSWDGLDQSGNRFPDGQHQVVIEAWDQLGRRVERSYLVNVSSQSATPVSLQLQVLSKHVKPHKGELAQVKAIASGPPTRYTFAVYRGSSPGGQPVYTSPEVVSATGVQELVWNGLDNAGSQVSNGSHVMVVTARADSGGSASANAHLVVNFQGGGHSSRPGSWLLALQTSVPSMLEVGLKFTAPLAAYGASLLQAATLGVSSSG